MSEVANNIIDGECCDLCGCYFEEAQDNPATCPDCWVDLTKYEKKGHTKSTSDTI